MEAQLMSTVWVAAGLDPPSLPTRNKFLLVDTVDKLNIEIIIIHILNNEQYHIIF